MGGSPSLLRRPAFEKSNAELTSSLRANILAYQHSASSAHPSQNATPEANVPSNAQDTASAPLNGVSHVTEASIPPTPLPPVSTWTHHESTNSTLFVPSPPPPTGPTLAEPRKAYDITAKLFFLPTTPVSQRGTYAREAISLVLTELGVPSLDLLIISFPGFSFDAEDDDEDDEIEDEELVDIRTERNDQGANGAGATDGHSVLKNGVSSSSTATEDRDILASYRDIAAALNPPTGDPVAARLGVAEFGARRLERFLRALDEGDSVKEQGQQAKLPKPSVDQLNVRDCCVVPRTLIQLARREGVELLTHNDCTDVLPPGTVREILGPVKAGGVGLLCASAGGNDGCDGLRGEVLPRFVVKYTAVVADRGVVENKGYFAVAELIES